MQTIGLIQLNVGPDPAQNLPNTLRFMQDAADQGANFILTPECSNFLTADGNSPVENSRYEADDLLLRETRKLCHERGIWVCLGSLILAQPDTPKLLNRQILVNPDGNIETRYDKIHLFDVTLDGGESYGESKTYDRGHLAKLTQIGDLSLGHSICYDLRFPALFRGLDAHIQVIPAAFTKTTGQAHWHTLLRARAIENGCFVLAAAQTGAHDGTRETFGHSLIIDPWGEILLDMGTDPGVACLTLDLDQVTKRRAQIPAMTQEQHFDWA